MHLETISGRKGREKEVLQSLSAETGDCLELLYIIGLTLSSAALRSAVTFTPDTQDYVRDSCYHQSHIRLLKA